MHLEDENVQNEVKNYKLSKDFRTVGWIYIISNEYMPGIYKIGKTTTSLEKRIKELSSSTSIPDKFNIEAAFYSDYPDEDEINIHKKLSEFRVNESREFFKAPLNKIIDICYEQGLVIVEEEIENLAEDYDVICDERLNKVDLNDLFEDLGIEIFGCKISALERLIRIVAHEIIEKNREEGRAFLFQNKSIYRVKSRMQKSYEDYIKKEKEFIGPRQPLQTKKVNTNI